MLETNNNNLASLPDKIVEIKLKSKHPEAVKSIIKSALMAALQSTDNGIKITERRLDEFETKYQLSTAEFLHKFNNNELPHSGDFDEWIGESRMLAHLLDKKTKIQGVELVD
ncbi:hypothetical protein [Okeania sp. SIO3B5]|uniref:hypothetical protein n=1 Tax=Okeania sp. SIO3B5 TaxID=2607811 RepID=UPI0025F6044F|nr:hypothetical protein [Okeania sp. SIO3B5]